MTHPAGEKNKGQPKYAGKEDGEKDASNGTREKKQPNTEHNVAHTADAELPDPNGPRVGKEVLTKEDEKKAS